MLAIMTVVIMFLSFMNFYMLYRLMGKHGQPNDSALYEEQIKALKKVIRLNDKMLKNEKERRDYEKSMESRTEANQGVVCFEEQKRIY